MKILFDEFKLERAVGTLGNVLEQFHVKKYMHEPAVFIGVQNGSFMFFADLVRRTGLQSQVDFTRVKSYNGTTQGDINMIYDIEMDVEGKVVYVVDDIIESGNTMKFLLEHFKTLGAKDVYSVALLRRKETTFKVDFHALDVEQSDWLIGYGLDDVDGFFRHHPRVYIK
jgi:hypoxanthine phosphoribosyltransferase